VAQLLQRFAEQEQVCFLFLQLFSKANPSLACARTFFEGDKYVTNLVGLWAAVQWSRTI
jgi:hypothetical protein